MKKKKGKWKERVEEGRGDTDAEGTREGKRGAERNAEEEHSDMRRGERALLKSAAHELCVNRL
ncbi:hypothetical protein, partial [Tenacibaculum discolor]|uniref:hypothetical protein n=1 Tax=Tenacibaculum discolor TaxID=361581 RepID=UPI001F1A7A09